ncbi:MAG: XdhC family protein [Planctomycetes bacterium]|nr:XdhC family protein [Planctomycetota bacterium]
MHHAVPLLESAFHALAHGQPVALCAVVATSGSAPQKPGALMIVHADGRTAGTIGGGHSEEAARRQAQSLIEGGRSRVQTFSLHGDGEEPVCGGTLDIAMLPLSLEHDEPRLRRAVESLRQRREVHLPLRVQGEAGLVEYHLRIEAVPTLLIAGAGHVGAEVARQAVRLDMHVRVFDDRADLLSPERLAEPIVGVPGPVAEALATETIDPNTYIVIVTRAHKDDQAALNAVIASPARYIGMIGSRRKIKHVFDNLVAWGVQEHLLARVHTPIGLPIHAVTVPEIGISIAAELIKCRREGGTKGPAVTGPFPVSTTAPGVLGEPVG